MTTGDQARRGTVERVDTGHPAVRADPAPTLPERLVAARERKGVDLFRAERDTKIRARYLAASSAVTTGNCRALSTRRGSCATTRSISGSSPTTSSSSGIWNAASR